MFICMACVYDVHVCVCWVYVCAYILYTHKLNTQCSLYDVYIETQIEYMYYIHTHMCLELIILVQITYKGLILEKMHSPFPSSHSLPARDHRHSEGTLERRIVEHNCQEWEKWRNRGENFIGNRGEQIRGMGEGEINNTKEVLKAIRKYISLCFPKNMCQYIIVCLFICTYTFIHTRHTHVCRYVYIFLIMLIPQAIHYLRETSIWFQGSPGNSANNISYYWSPRFLTEV